MTKIPHLLFDGAELSPSDRFARYRAVIPYAVPRLTRRRDGH
ncbi:hypothetical protein ACTGWA_10920 [Streptococcus suis]